MFLTKIKFHLSLKIATSTVCLSSWCESGATSTVHLTPDTKVEPHQEHFYLPTQEWSHINRMSVLLMWKWSHINSMSVFWHKNGATSIVFLSPDTKVELHQQYVCLLTQKWSHINSMSVSWQKKWSHINSMSVSWHKSGTTFVMCILHLSKWYFKA
jgi:hypothetical protein